MKRFDERDTLFARLRLKEGTKQYESYYLRHPDYKETDDALRKMPNKQGYPALIDDVQDSVGRLFSQFNEIESAKTINDKVCEMPTEQRTKLIKEVAKYYGASAVGIAEITDEYYYSHHGARLEEDYGKPVETSLPFAIVLAVELDKDYICRAPHVEATMATVRGYRDVAFTGMNLALFIRNQGFDTYLNSVARYRAPMVPLAALAGLGQIGLNQMLVTRTWGPRVRLGAVMTDMPLIPDEPIDFGLDEFCQECRLCVKSCVGRAIVKGSEFNEHDCMKAWKRLGTDCGVCLMTCPFSQGVDDELLDTVKRDDCTRNLIEDCFGKGTDEAKELDIVKWSKI